MGRLKRIEESNSAMRDIILSLRNKVSRLEKMYSQLYYIQDSIYKAYNQWKCYSVVDINEDANVNIRINNIKDCNSLQEFFENIKKSTRDGILEYLDGDAKEDILKILFDT